MVAMKKSRDIDMTEGPIFKKLLIFCLPLIATNLLQTLYNAADMMVVSLSHEANAVGAIGTTGSLVGMIINIFIGFSIGANVVVARSVGARDDKATERAVHTAIVMSVIFGLLGGAVGFFVARPVLSLLGNQGNLLDLATRYTQIYCCGVPFISVTNYCVSIFRAKGDTKTPLYVLSSAGVLNVLLNLFFVLVTGLSVEGVALATSLSNVASAAVLLFLLTKEKGACRFTPKKLGIDHRAFGNILQIGLPAGIQGALFALSNMLIMSSVLSVNNSLGLPPDGYQPIVDGNAAVNNLENFLYMAMNSITQASVSFVGQNLGAGKFKRIRKVVWQCLFFSIAINVFGSLLFLVLQKPLLALYGIVEGVDGSLQRIAFETAGIRLRLVLLPYVLMSFMDVGSGALRGLGKSMASTVICLLGACVFRSLWVFTVFPAFGTLESIYLSYPISWVLTGGVLFAFFLIESKRLIKFAEEKQISAEKTRSSL